MMKRTLRDVGCVHAGERLTEVMMWKAIDKCLMKGWGSRDAEGCRLDHVKAPYEVSEYIQYPSLNCLPLFRLLSDNGCLYWARRPSFRCYCPQDHEHPGPFVDEETTNKKDPIVVSIAATLNRHGIATVYPHL